MSCPSALTVAERFWAKVDMSGGPDACWPYLGATTPDGYAVFRVDKNGTGLVYGHRFAWALQNGPIPPGHEIMHGAHREDCSTRACCNFDHLKPGTHRENCQQIHREKRWGGAASTLTEAEL